MDFWALTNDIVNSKNFIKRCILKTIKVGGRRQKKKKKTLGLSLRKAAKVVLLSVWEKTVLLANNAALLILTLKASHDIYIPLKMLRVQQRRQRLLLATEPLTGRGKGYLFW